MVVFDPKSQQLVEVTDLYSGGAGPNAPTSIRVPFLRQEIGAGDVIAGITQALGVTPCTPCEERRRKLNQKLTLTPWGT